MAQTSDAYTCQIGTEFTYTGELDKKSRLAYGKGRATHVARKDLYYEGTFVNNKRTGLSM